MFRIRLPQIKCQHLLRFPCKFVHDVSCDSALPFVPRLYLLCCCMETLGALVQHCIAHTGAQCDKVSLLCSPTFLVSLDKTRKHNELHSLSHMQLQQIDASSNHPSSSGTPFSSSVCKRLIDSKLVPKRLVHQFNSDLLEMVF